MNGTAGESGTGVETAAAGETPLVEAIAAGIAHEVRNPLNALQINLGILEQELSEIVPDRASHVFEVIGKIAGELRSLDNFVTEFLRFARPPRPALEPVEVRSLLADLVTFIGPECSRKGVSLSLDHAGRTRDAERRSLPAEARGAEPGAERTAGDAGRGRRSRSRRRATPRRSRSGCATPARA